MRMEIRRLHRQSIESFASMNDLTLKVYEREHSFSLSLPRWYCHFSELEVMRNGALVSVSGNGNTIQEAVEDYCQKLSGQYVALNAMSNARRRQFHVPVLTPEYEGEKQ